MADTPATPAPSQSQTTPADQTTTDAAQNGSTTANGATQQQSTTNDDVVPKTWDEIFNHSRFKTLVNEKTEYKNKLDQYEQEKANVQKQKDIEAGNFQKVIEDLTPKAERATALEEALTKVIEAEINAIPEERRSLIPELPTEKKLEWIVQNRAFLLGEKGKANMNSPTNPDTSNNSANNQRFTRAQINDMKFFEEHKEEIKKAAKEGRIDD